MTSLLVKSSLSLAMLLRPKIDFFQTFNIKSNIKELYKLSSAEEKQYCDNPKLVLP